MFAYAQTELVDWAGSSCSAIGNKLLFSSLPALERERCPLEDFLGGDELEAC
jgi:hypothetical protein